ncbi:unnamed protein product [Microthlaspi erraticum]|uniref:Uncharacterized protein n=1 Tax=Microthlaspi erraticum TaxID=1685480 RepID=A0A6D2KUZ1_9BRAS|nr:unnamed protein product [Microthlaspi erraticum]
MHLTQQLKAVTLTHVWYCRGDQLGHFLTLFFHHPVQSWNQSLLNLCNLSRPRSKSSLKASSNSFAGDDPLHASGQRETHVFIGTTSKLRIFFSEKLINW